MNTEELSSRDKIKYDDIMSTLAAQQIEYEAVITSPKILKPRLTKLCENAIDDRLVTLQRTATEAQRKTPTLELYKALTESFPTLWTDLYDIGVKDRYSGRSVTMHHVGKITRAMAREMIKFLDTEWTPTEEEENRDANEQINRITLLCRTLVLDYLNIHRR